MPCAGPSRRRGGRGGEATCRHPFQSSRGIVHDVSRPLHTALLLFRRLGAPRACVFNSIRPQPRDPRPVHGGQGLAGPAPFCPPLSAPEEIVISRCVTEGPRRGDPASRPTTAHPAAQNDKRKTASKNRLPRWLSTSRALFVLVTCAGVYNASAGNCIRCSADPLGRCGLGGQPSQPASTSAGETVAY